MIVHVKKLIETQTTALSIDERNLVVQAYKGKAKELRGSFNALAACEKREKELAAASTKAAAAKAYKEKIATQLRECCDDIITLISDVLLKRDIDNVGEIYFQKTKADYYRYRAEASDDATASSDVGHAKDLYEVAHKNAQFVLGSADPTRLGLALNYSVFMHDVLGEQQDAVALCARGVRRGLDHVDKLEKADYKESTGILELLRDNLTIWSESME